MRPEKTTDTERDEIREQTEYNVDCRNLIFLPFNNTWNFFLQFTIILNSSVVLYHLAFLQENHEFVLILHYTMEVPFLLDTILGITHRNMYYHRITRNHEPRSIFLLAIDVISLIPVYEIYLFLNSISRSQIYNPVLQNVSWTLAQIRLYRVFLFLHGLSKQAGRNQVIIITIAEVLEVYLITFVMSLAWKVMACWRCVALNWTINIDKIIFDPGQASNWFIICFVTMGSFLLYSWRGYIRPETNGERWIVTGTMTLGYIMHAMAYCGKLTEAIQKYLIRQYVFERQLLFIVNLLKDWKVPKEIQAKTLEYYETLWVKRSGIFFVPDIFNMLPMTLQKEVSLDINFEALRHSQVFQDMPMPFKRSLSCRMKTEMYLPGDYVYKKGEMKHKMIYIVSGVIQILSDEDEESPIISFSNGTVLGEMCLMIPSASNAYMRASTYCEIQTLTCRDLYMTLSSFSDLTYMVKELIDYRIALALYLKVFKEQKHLEKKQSGSSTKRVSNLKWLKGRWRQLVKLQSKKAMKDETILTRHVKHEHTSRNLDLLVLSEDFELKTKAICLTAKCPFILEATSSFRRTFDYIIIVSATLQAVVLPYSILILKAIPNSMQTLLLIADLLFVCDIYLQASTTVKDQTQILAKPSQILKYKLTSLSFMIDCLAIAPLNIIAAVTGLHAYSLLFRLNRVLKIYRLLLFIIHREKTLLINYAVIRIVKYMVVLVFLVYWFSCLMYGLLCPFANMCLPYSWLVYMSMLEGNKYKHENSVFRAIHYVFSTFFHMNTSNAIEHQLIELVFAYVTIITSNFLSLFFTAELAASFFVRYRETETYQIYIQSLKNFMIENKINQDLRKQVAELLKFQWYHNQNTSLVGENGVLTNAPLYLKNLIIYRRIIMCLKNCQLFLGSDEGLLRGVAAKMIYRTLPPGAVVCAADNRSRWLHCIVRGYCTLTSTMPGDKERGHVSILKPGDAFPLIEMLHEVLVLVNVRTLTSVEIISINCNDFNDILHAHQQFRKGLRAVLEAHMNIFEKSLLRKKGRLPDISPIERSKGQGDLFKYDLMDDELIDHDKLAFEKPFMQLGRWKWIRLLFLRSCIDPNKKRFFYWEIARFTIDIIRTIIAITYYNVLIYYHSALDPVLMFFTCTNLIDMYVRMHLQYYNNKNILVTHPLYTAKHYLQTTFIIDVWCIFPIGILAKLLGRKKLKQTEAILKITSRPFGIYRIISYLNYKQSNIDSSKTSTIQVAKYGLATITFLGIVASFLQLDTCTIIRDQFGKVVVTVFEGNWHAKSKFSEMKKPEEIFLQCFYVVISLFTGIATGVYRSAEGHITSNVSMYIIIFVAKMFLFTRLVGSRIRRNVNLTIFFEKVRNFEQFMDKEMVDEDLVQAAIEHYKFRWKRNKGNNISKNLSQFHPQLHEDITYDLYADTLKAADFFEGADNSFFRLMGTQLTEVHYKKDGQIIRCNDVQNLIYIVHKGRVDVLVAQTKVATMGRGGIFGCLSKLGKFRHTISVKAKVHTSLLAIDSIAFHKVISRYNHIVVQVQRANFMNAEFLESKHYTIVVDDKEDYESSSTAASSYRIAKTSRSILKLKRLFHLRVDSDRRKYMRYNYIASCHIAPLSAIFYVLVAFSRELHETFKLYIQIISAACDIFFVAKIFIKFHLMYRDPDTGILVRDFKLLAKRYVYSPRKFWLDLISCIPIQLILSLVGVGEDSKLGYANRILRFDFLIQYYYEKREKLDVRTHLQITYFFYWVLFIIQTTSSIWTGIACAEKGCHYIINIGTKEEAVVYARDMLDNLSLLYSYALTMFTTTGLRTVAPVTMSQLGVGIALAILFFGVSIELASGFITMSSINNYSMRRYERNIEDLKMYLHDCHLSPFIFNKVWQYYLQLWQRQRGEWTPALILEAPSYLQQDLMYSLYGRYIESHIIFSKTHVHFIRQLVTHLKRSIYFPGNYLAEAGDIDGCMYFIHSGLVDVIDKVGLHETHLERLSKGGSFGEAQGLIGVPHKCYYRAHSVVDVVVLRYEDWMHLLQWFPASKEAIWKGAAEMGFMGRRNRRNR